MIRGVPKLLIHVFRRLLTVLRAPITIGMTDTFLQFQIFCTSIIYHYYYYYYYNPRRNLRRKLQTFALFLCLLLLLFFLLSGRENTRIK